MASWFQAQWQHPSKPGVTVYGDIVDRRDECERQDGITEIPRAKGDRKTEYIRQKLLHEPTPRSERR